MMKKSKVNVDKTGKINYDQFSLTTDLQQNIAIMKEIFINDDTVIYREFTNHYNEQIKCCAIFIDGMVNTDLINEHIVKPITEVEIGSAREIATKVIWGNDVKRRIDIADIIKVVLYGDTLILIDGIAEAITMNTKGFAYRSISEPDDERVLRGPREGFTEAIMINLSMIRRKLQTSDLKFSFQSFGTRSNTMACICYLDSLVNKDVLADLEKRLSKISDDGFFSTNPIDELIKDSPFSIFKTAGTTEKPDVVAAKLLEGRVAVILDGTPVVLTVPYLFIENFQSPDDYYTNFFYSSFGRLLRIFGFIVSISIPAIYVSLAGFHKEMIPTPFLLSIAAATKGVPFPVIIECILLIGMFEVLREAGVRMPNKIGQALSIVGALVIGQSAVEAKIISAPVVIVIATAGITGLMLPRLASAIIILRLALLLFSAFLGLYAYVFFLIGLIIYLLSLQSYGISYMSGFMAKPSNLTDIYIRAPKAFQQKRPIGLSADVERRTST